MFRIRDIHIKLDELKTETFRLQQTTNFAELTISSVNGFQMALAQKLLLKNQYPPIRLRWINAINKVIMQNYVAKVKQRIEFLAQQARERASKGHTKMVRKMLCKTADQITDLHINYQLSPLKHDLAARLLHLQDSPTQQHLHSCSATGSPTSAFDLSARRISRVTAIKNLRGGSGIVGKMTACDSPSSRRRRTTLPPPVSDVPVLSVDLAPITNPAAGLPVGALNTAHGNQTCQSLLVASLTPLYADKPADIDVAVISSKA